MELLRLVVHVTHPRRFREPAEGDCKGATRFKELSALLPGPLRDVLAPGFLSYLTFQELFYWLSVNKAGA